ncbi:DEAD/DEAH box helicase [Bradyrhizobium sp. NBAIM20]|uniref:DEAD/DEAH box helicase n=1 Tax=unclassified Bradyrhizobium TaxID=2631580 RepID=UPI001CD1A405|nr:MULTISPECIES: DEAD/DEAH box helicase [unclassified Bradyrhizobium]MCA1412671.1 DEAD/DEAH box helicase [Bradyrhizobium sp. NBAIM20]MCA1463479.1 DEAD/DEAH box helicase [Bradyrhizobium sp. NBAIM18]
MNPIILSRQVEQSLKDLVRATLNTTSLAFDGTVERFLAEPANYIKGPWISVAMPFKQSVAPGEPFEQPFPKVPLRFAPYQHQLTAFERLGGKSPRSTLVATGTGSGKTESYLWPILEHCRVNLGKPGIKAILIYPMNALATDQARRIARAINEIPSLNGVRAGIYADAEPVSPSDAMTEQEVITRRAAMWERPPDVLLTNYKMLDYLLLRGRDQPLWATNAPETLRFLVVDELHTFDGAQGADLALLIRRLKHRLGTPAGHLVCVGSSATLGSGADAAAELRAYAGTIFGETFDEEAVIRETRQTPDEFFPEAEYFEWPDDAKVETALDRSMGLSQAETARYLAKCLFPEPDDGELEQIHKGDPASIAWRLLLGRLLREHVATQRVVRIIAEAQAPLELGAIAEQLGKVKALSKRTLDARVRLAELIVSLVAWARSGSEAVPQPLFGVRIQTWVREMAGMVATLPHWQADNKRSPIDLAHARDREESALKRMLPLVNCTRCGTTAHIGRLPPAGNSLGAPLNELYEEYFDDRSTRLRMIYHESVSRKAGTSGRGGVVTGLLDCESLEFIPGDHDNGLEPGTRSPVWLYDPTAGGSVDRTCPACGYGHGLLLFGLRASRITAALANTLYASQHNEEDPQAKPRLLMFSDSVQDAAQRAAVTEIRNTVSVVRKSLFKALRQSETQGLTLSDVIKKLPAKLRAELGDESFAASFITRDQTWRDPYQQLLRSDHLPDGDRFMSHVEWMLGWEYFEDLTYLSHMSSSLEASGIAVADVSPDMVDVVAESLPGRLANVASGHFEMSRESAARFICGLLQQMRRRGAVGHEYIVKGMQSPPRNIGGPNYFAAARSLGIKDVLPIPNHRKGPAPAPVTLLRSCAGYQPLLQDHSTNWYRDWADKFFPAISLALVSQYDIIFKTTMDCLEAASIVRRIDRVGPSTDHGYVIEPEVITVTDRVVHLRCNACRRREIALEDSSSVVGSPCTRIACHGTLEKDDHILPASATALLDTDRNHRVVGFEHTGILEVDERREIERGFIDKEAPWAPNLISATPTLEMGIDIGDLSTLVLCSVPPEEANYIQRIGRSGRRDGNSLNFTIATTRQHDLQFWEDPQAMLSGRVRAPGVYIGALSVLLRQAAAFSLDCFVATGEQTGDYGKVRNVLRQLDESRGDGFPLDWFLFLEQNGAEIAKRFIALLPAEVAIRPKISRRITEYLAGRDDQSLIWQIRSIFDEARTEREELITRRNELDAEAKRVKRRAHEMTEEKLNERLAEIKRDKGQINHAIRQSIDDVSVLRYLTDKGVLPNYAFPEEGVKLKSILSRQSDDGRRIENGDNLVTREYVRPASNALTEFALGQTFYASGREVQIERIDLNKQDQTTFRFCQNCSHVEFTATAEASANCPRCGDEMWGDGGSTHNAIDLRTVIAVTSEQQAAIRDSDERQQKRYDRSLVPFYGPADIETSWYGQDHDGSTAPFGFEFIARCGFRDFNFGPRASAPVGPRIAGENRKSRPFRICCECGTVQRPPRGDDDPGEHTARCKVKRDDDGELAREAWEAEVFLMRKFETESIRMIVPVMGEASHDDIKSFVAGINLGMRTHFAGKVDHIRSTVVEAQLDGLAAIRSLFLYDAVPGGSGYLRQLAQHPDSMRTVVEAAAQALRTCPCVAVEGKTGCFRCVKSYRAQFGAGEPDRDTALQMMDSILASWSNLTRTETGIDARVRNFAVESKLESRFIQKLVERFGEGCVKPHVLEGGRKGHVLKISEGDRSHFWNIETQVQIDRRFRDVPRKRVDFLFSPIGGSNARPIVVEMDGLKYHADTVVEDLTTRLLLMRSGHTRVWTLGWQDLEEGAAAPPNPFTEARLGAAHAGILANVLARPEMADLQTEIDFLQNRTSLEGLFYLLSYPEIDCGAAASVLVRTVVGRGRDIATLPRISALSDDGRLFLEESDLFGHIVDRNLDVYLSTKKVAPSSWRDEVDDCRVLLRGTLPGVPGDQTVAPGYSEAWRGLWRLVNFLQDLPGFHVEFQGLDTLEAPDVDTVGTAPIEGAWLEILSLAGEGFRSLVEALRAADAPVPDRQGFDVTSEGEVVGMIELGWSQARLAICEEPFETAEWDLIVFEPETGQSVTQVVAMVLRKIEGRAA